ncbi:MAG: hypothetical protein M1816_002124 [Peltula sp. TS41687]|nr:MAG: hypothetical protein M1816_002124 [Peltula sp. TS41687]
MRSAGAHKRTRSRRSRRQKLKDGYNQDSGGVALPVMRGSRTKPMPTAEEDDNYEPSLQLPAETDDDEPSLQLLAEEDEYEPSLSQSAQYRGIEPSSVETGETIPTTHTSHTNDFQTVLEGVSLLGPVSSVSNPPVSRPPQPNRGGTIQVEERRPPLGNEDPFRSWHAPHTGQRADVNYPPTIQNQPAYSPMQTPHTMLEQSNRLLQMGMAGQGMLPDQQTQAAYQQYLTANTYASIYANMQFQAAFSPHYNPGFAFPNLAPRQQFQPGQSLRSHHTMPPTSSHASGSSGFIIPMVDEPGTAPSPTPSMSQTERTTSKPPKSRPLPTRRKIPGSRPVTPPPTPIPTEAYLLQASQPPVRLKQPQHLLLVIDLNGTLLYRPNLANSSKLVARPGIEPFLAYIFSSFQIMIWSSSRAKNVELMCDKIFNAEQAKRLIARWGRETLGLTDRQYNNKVQVFKRLEWVWDKAEVASSHPAFLQDARWDQSNTVLIDDSVLKGAGQPFNILEVPEFAGREESRNKDTLMKVAAYLDELRFHHDVSAFMRANPFVVDGSWRKETLSSAV